MEINFKKMETPQEIQAFWVEKRKYEERDIFPSLEETGEELAEIIQWFESDEYYEIIMELHEKPKNGGTPLQFVFFYGEENSYLGFGMYKVYGHEDGKGFIFDYCIEPSLRNQQLGSRVFEALERLMQSEGCKYLELNASCEANRRFWMRLGFEEKALDEFGEMVYVKK